MAPLEGITTYVFRAVYHRHFKDFDKYFTPFLTSTNLSWKEKNEIAPEHNEGLNLVPQILTNIPDTFACIANQLKAYGYETVNLNLGCPSGTVVSKKRGAGQLRDTYALEHFFEEIFEKSDVKISVKTRIGMEDSCEWEDILEVYKKFPFEEIIVHPRLRKDFYNGLPRMDAYRQIYECGLNIPICYNGDIVSLESAQKIVEQFPGTDSCMIGRGMLRNPDILSSTKQNTCAPEKLYEFLQDLCESYKKLYGPGQDRNVLFKLKDIWNFLGLSYPDKERELKKIRKADSISEYNIAVRDFISSVS